MSSSQNSSLPKPSSVGLTDLVFSLGLLLALIGAGHYFLAKANQPTTTAFRPGAITERQLAIANALRTGNRTYTYTTNFIPGIGTITDPNQYKSGLLDSLKNFAPPKL